ncbi:MAG: hypothetical protein HQL58_10610, partial [Magnetococcales bacterium]|nr:hypothetical protein [Magnetococcales bacterium]
MTTFSLNGAADSTASSAVGTAAKTTDSVTISSSGSLSVSSIETITGAAGTDVITLLSAGSVAISIVETVV